MHGFRRIVVDIMGFKERILQDNNTCFYMHIPAHTMCSSDTLLPRYDKKKKDKNKEMHTKIPLNDLNDLNDPSDLNESF